MWTNESIEYIIHARVKKLCQHVSEIMKLVVQKTKELKAIQLVECGTHGDKFVTENLVSLCQLNQVGFTKAADLGVSVDVKIDGEQKWKYQDYCEVAKNCGDDFEETNM